MAGGNLEQPGIGRSPVWLLGKELAFTVSTRRSQEGHSQNSIFKRCPWLPGRNRCAGVSEGSLVVPKWESKAWESVQEFSHLLPSG